MPSLVFLATETGKSNVAQPREYTTTSSKGLRKPRFLADNVEQTKSRTQISVHIPTTNNCATISQLFLLCNKYSYMSEL